MAILQVRSISDDLYGALGKRAALEHRSIRQEVIRIIQRYLATPPHSLEADEEALRLAGSWQDSRTAESIARAIRGGRSTRRFQEQI